MTRTRPDFDSRFLSLTFRDAEKNSSWLTGKAQYNKWNRSFINSINYTCVNVLFHVNIVKIIKNAKNSIYCNAKNTEHVF